MFKFVVGLVFGAIFFAVIDYFLVRCATNHLRKEMLETGGYTVALRGETIEVKKQNN